MIGILILCPCRAITLTYHLFADGRVSRTSDAQRTTSVFFLRDCGAFSVCMQKTEKAAPLHYGDKSKREREKLHSARVR